METRSVFCAEDVLLTSSGFQDLWAIFVVPWAGEARRSGAGGSQQAGCELRALVQAGMAARSPRTPIREIMRLML